MKKFNNVNMMRKKEVFKRQENQRIIKWAKDSALDCNNVILNDRKYNFYSNIANNVVDYFLTNDIAWWTCEAIQDTDTQKPTRHLRSSQVACLNHLYPLRYDREAVLSIAKTLYPDVDDVMQINTDKHFPAYIAFEAVSDIDHLNETKDGQKLTRGTMCTSVDALIYAIHKNGTKILMPIEWKYTESYHEEGKPDKDYSLEDRKYGEKEAKGKERLKRYSDLITHSQQLKSLDNYKSSVYFFEPFYQLMRQTLWAEQMIDNKATETIKADNFIHIHVIPKENVDLLHCEYDVSKMGMEETWRDCLQNQDKYKIVSPKDLLAYIDNVKYKELTNYLSTRYWI
jgi:hypothetical protein